MRQVNLRLSDDQLAAVNELRQGVPRERYLRAIVVRHLAYYGGESTFDARAYVAVAELPAPRKRRRQLITALDARRGDTPRMCFTQQTLEDAFGVDGPLSRA